MVGERKIKERWEFFFGGGGNRKQKKRTKKEKEKEIYEKTWKQD